MLCSNTLLFGSRRKKQTLFSGQKFVGSIRVRPKNMIGINERKCISTEHIIFVIVILSYVSCLMNFHDYTGTKTDRHNDSRLSKRQWQAS